MGHVAVEAKGLTHGYGNSPLFKNFDLSVTRGERLALIGPNGQEFGVGRSFFLVQTKVCLAATHSIQRSPGAGKSTLLRLIMGRESPQSGTVALGRHSVVANYYEQNQAEALDPQLTVLQTLEMYYTVNPSFFFVRHCALLAGMRNYASVRITMLFLHAPVCRAGPHARMDDIKALLGRMMFSGATIEKQVRYPIKALYSETAVPMRQVSIPGAWVRRWNA